MKLVRLTCMSLFRVGLHLIGTVVNTKVGYIDFLLTYLVNTHNHSFIYSFISLKYTVQDYFASMSSQLKGMNMNIYNNIVNYEIWICIYVNIYDTFDKIVWL